VRVFYKLAKKRFIIIFLRWFFIPKADNRKLNFGSGDWYYPRWETIDKKNNFYIDYHIDMNKQKEYPFDDNSVSIIVCFNTLYYLDYNMAQNALDEFYRILKPSGVLRVSVFDEDTTFPDVIRQIKEGSIKSMYTKKSLINMFKKAGFSKPYVSGCYKSTLPELRKDIFDRDREGEFHIEAIKSSGGRK